MQPSVPVTPNPAPRRARMLWPLHLVLIAVLTLSGAGACELEETLVVDPDSVRSVDLTVSQSVSAATPPEGGSTSFTVTVRNNGPVEIDSVVGMDTLTSGLSYVSHAIGNKGAYDPATRIWHIGRLDIGEEATLTIVARANAGTSGSQQRNVAGVTPATQAFVDSALANNLTAASVSVNGTLPPAEFANEPPGFVPLTNNFWTQHTGNGWTYTGPDPSGNFTRVVTSGYGEPAPVGGGSVLEAVYFGGSQGGSGPGRTGFSLPGGRDELFVGMWQKFSTDYPASPVFGGNKMWFMLVGPARSYLVFRERVGEPSSRYWDLALDSFQPTTGVNSNPPRIVPYGVWFKLEWYMKRNTPGNADGIARVWMNGELLVNRTDLVFPGSISAFYHEGTNNGATGSIIPRDGRWWMAQTRISVPGPSLRQ